ncbi:MAG TPA: hypothetical protein VGC85_05225 [Chthoniobacterales bacterium]
MIKSCVVALSFWAVAAVSAQEFFDELEQHLSVSAFHENVRVKLSGTLDLEYYHFDQPPPGLIDAAGHDLFNPRLTLFVDAQLGPALYFFSQTRVDRHFDPSDRGAQVRLDEYALRFTPWKDGRVSLQVGKFATVFGMWVTRHLSWGNPFITAPLVYENALPLEDMAAPELPFEGRRHDEKHEYISEVWGPDYTSGVSLAGRVGKVEYAVEFKNAALGARPESWDATRVGFDDPSVNGRIGFRPNEAWNVGFSASDGAYLHPQAESTLPSGKDIGDYHERVVAQDISFEHHHLQLFAEFHEAQFEIPRIGDGNSFGYFIEATYKLTPQLIAALRWNQQFFDDVPNGAGARVTWAPDISRLELAGTYRFTEHMHLKLEYYVEDEQGRADLSHNFAAQFTVRF